jgi:hypothetical protein
VGTQRLTLADGGLSPEIVREFVFLKPAATGVSLARMNGVNPPQNVKFSVNLATGVFSGTFVYPGVTPAAPRPFSGVLFQKQNVGIGNFTGPQTTGAAEIELK